MTTATETDRDHVMNPDHAELVAALADLLKQIDAANLQSRLEVRVLFLSRARAALTKVQS